MNSISKPSAAMVDPQQPAPSAAGEPHGVLAWPKPGPENPTWTICPKFLEKIMRSSASEYMPGLEEIEAVLLGLRTLFSAGRVALPGWESEYGEKCPKCHGIGYYDEGHEYDDGTMGSGNYVDCEKCKPSPTPQADSQPAPFVDQHSANLSDKAACASPVIDKPAAVLDRDRIREIFMAHGFTVKEGQTDLKQYVYDAADALLRAASAPADSVAAPEYADNGMFKGETIEKAAEHWANWCYVRSIGGVAEFLRFVAEQVGGVLEDAARWFSERDNVLHSFWVLLGEAEAQADNDNDPLLKHQVEGFYRQWNALNGSALVPRWVTRAARKQGGA